MAEFENVKNLVYFGLPRSMDGVHAPRASASGAKGAPKHGDIGYGLADGTWERLVLPEGAQPVDGPSPSDFNLGKWDKLVLDIGPLSPFHEFLFGFAGGTSERELYRPRLEGLIAQLGAPEKTVVVLDQAGVLDLRAAHIHALVFLREKKDLGGFLEGRGRRWRGIIHHDVWGATGALVPTFRNLNELGQIVDSVLGPGTEAIKHDMGMFEGHLASDDSYVGLEYIRRLNATALVESMRSELVQLLFEPELRSAIFAKAERRGKFTLKSAKFITGELLSRLL